RIACRLHLDRIEAAPKKHLSVELLNFAFTALRVWLPRKAKPQYRDETHMTDGHDPKKEQAQSARELAIRLLFEEDPEKQEALVAQLAEILKGRRGQPRVA